MKKRVKVKPPSISDHALIRFCERRLEFDFELVRAQILKSFPDNYIEKLIDGKYPLQDGGKAVIKNHRVVTIID